MNLEIERRFLLDRLPAIPPESIACEVEQGYLPDAPSTAGEPTRLRRAIQPDGSVHLTRTVKTGTGLVRHEKEHAITAPEFDELWPQTAGRRLRKTRYHVPDGDLEWEVDEFHDLDLVVAEIELPSTDTAVELPQWLAPHVVREVTEEPAYNNYELARKSH